MRWKQNLLAKQIIEKLMHNLYSLFEISNGDNKNKCGVEWQKINKKENWKMHTCNVLIYETFFLHFFKHYDTSTHFNIIGKCITDIYSINSYDFWCG